MSLFAELKRRKTAAGLVALAIAWYTIGQPALRPQAADIAAVPTPT